MQPDLDSKIEKALTDYFRAIEDQKLSDPAKRPPLRPHFEALDALRDQLPQGANPRLRHFMEQKSYEKALQLLQGKT